MSREPEKVDLNVINLAEVRGALGWQEDLFWTNWPVWIVTLLEEGEEAIPNQQLLEFLRQEKDNFEFDAELGVLYHKVDNIKTPFIPWMARADMVTKWHVGRGHVGWLQLYDDFKKRAWWPGMRKDIQEWISRCTECQLHGRLTHQPHVEAGIMKTNLEPFERWGIDFIGILPTTEKGNRWIITAIDHATRWCVARALKDATYEEIARFIYDEIVIRFGAPAEIVTDRGRNFLAKGLETYLDLMQVKHLRTSAYHPRTNGKTESLNGKIGRMLAKAVQGARHKWDEFVDEAVFNCNTRVHLVTGFTPFRLVYGVDPKVPGDTMRPYCLDEGQVIDRVEIRARLLEGLGQDRAAAMARSNESALQAKERYDRLVKEDPFRKDDWVLLKRGNRFKFMSKWVGPFKVNDVGPNGIYQLMEPGGDIKVDWVHRDRLKRCAVDVENLPTRFWTEEILEEMDEEFGFSQEGNDSVTVQP